MRNIVLSGLGWLLIALTVLDVFWTVLWSGNGGGPVTTLLTRTGRRVLPALAGGRRWLHSAIGPLVLLAVVATWAGLLLVGFTLALQMDPDAIRSSSTNLPADWIERGYLVGYTLFTLGYGDFVPTTDVMRVVVVFMNAVGMFLITLSVTYLLPVISASVGSRAFASSATSLGEAPEDIVVNAWDGERIHLDHELRDLADQLSILGHQHLAYPVLHLFHSADPAASAPLAVATLDDALTLLDAVDPRVAPSKPCRRLLRAAIQRYTTTYGPEMGTGDPSPAPSLQALAAAGIPLLQDQTSFEATVDEQAEWRGRVQRLARASGIGGR